VCCYAKEELSLTIYGVLFYFPRSDDIQYERQYLTLTRSYYHSHLLPMNKPLMSETRASLHSLKIAASKPTT
jgi:hypothetical protein